MVNSLIEGCVTIQKKVLLWAGENSYSLLYPENFLKGYLMDTKPEQAEAAFMNGFNCAQAVFSTYAEEFGIDRTNALKISCGFGAGMGRRQEVCGALSGAILLIGCKYGKTIREDNAANDLTYKLVRELSDKFIATHGSISCKELLGCNLQTPEGQQFFKVNNFKEKKCGQYVHSAAEIVEEILMHD
jgi:C_GCAxxG_C_C family probable redox protein